jgi:hypothetical protein
MVKQPLLFSVLLGTIATFISNSPQHAPTLLKPVSDTTYFEDFPPYKSVQKNEKLALFKGNMQLTAFKYSFMKPFNKDGLAYVKVKYDSCGFIDKNGKEIIQPIYRISEYADFADGLLYVGKSNDPNNYFVHVNGKIEKEVYNEKAGLQHVMNPTKFPALLSKYKKLADSIVFNDRNCFRCDGISKWTTESILGRALRAFLEEPHSYGLDISIIGAYGLPGGGGNYWTGITYSEGWGNFREKTIFQLLKNENSRKLVWPWLKENYKSTYLLLHPQFRKKYKQIAASLKQYFSDNYDPKKVEQFLKDTPNDFAYVNPMNTAKEMIGRKTAAFVERLIYVHKVMNVDDAKRWVAIVCNEVQSWP